MSNIWTSQYSCPKFRIKSCQTLQPIMRVIGAVMIFVRLPAHDDKHNFTCSIESSIANQHSNQLPPVSRVEVHDIVYLFTLQLLCDPNYSTRIPSCANIITSAKMCQGDHMDCGMVRNIPRPFHNLLFSSLQPEWSESNNHVFSLLISPPRAYTPLITTTLLPFTSV